MNTADIRHALIRIHRKRGELTAFATRHRLNYNRLVKFIGRENCQLWHDNALEIIKAIQKDNQERESI